MGTIKMLNVRRWKDICQGVQAREWATNSTFAKITWWLLTRISIFKLRRDSKMTSMFGVQKLSSCFEVCTIFGFGVSLPKFAWYVQHLLR